MRIFNTLPYGAFPAMEWHTLVYLSAMHLTQKAKERLAMVSG